MTERLDKMIPRHKVMSAAVREIGYVKMPYTGNDELELGVVDVLLTTGNLYRYYDVPFSVYSGVRHSASVGAAYNLALKDKYPCALVRKIERARKAS